MFCKTKVKLIYQFESNMASTIFYNIFLSLQFFLFNSIFLHGFNQICHQQITLICMKLNQFNYRKCVFQVSRNKNIMQLLSQEKLFQPNLNLSKRQPQQQPKMKKIQDKKQIKINKRKLPLDFFKGTVKRSLSRRSPLEQYSKQCSTQKDIYFRKQPQTQRKISSHQNLPFSQLDHVNQFCFSNTQISKFDNEHKNSIHRRIIHLEQHRNNSKTVSASLNTTLQRLCPKTIKSKQFFTNIKMKQLTNHINFHPFLSKNKQTSLDTFSKVQRNIQTKQKAQSQNSQIIDLNCTFGKGFKKSQSFSLQNTILFRDDLISQNNNIDMNQNTQIQQQISRQKLTHQLNSAQKKYRDQRSTQQSQIMQALRYQQNSPKKQYPRRKLFAYQLQNTRQDKELQNKFKTSQKMNRIKWNNSKNNIIDSLKQLQLKSSKDIYTSEAKQRISKNRDFINSSNQYRDTLHNNREKSKSIKREKVFQDLNLPKIDKILSMS